MKKYMCVGLLCIITLAATATLLPPSYARQQNTAVWSAELLPRSDTSEPEPELKSDLLVEGGQTVLLSKDEPYNIELELWSPDTDNIDLDVAENNCIAAVEKPTEDKNKYILSIEKTEDQKTEEEDQDISDDITYSVTLTWNCNGKELSATFEYMSEPQIDDNSADKKAEFNGLPAQYNENVPISFTVGEAPVKLTMDGKDFPPRLRFTVNEETFVLYDGGAVVLKEGDICSLDFSTTDFRQNLVLTAGEYKAEVAYLPFPELQSDVSPLIMDEETLDLPVSFMWGDAEPDVKIYQLIPADNGSVEWQEHDKITAQSSDSGQIQLLSNGSLGGTYKIVINWQQCHYIETNFYIRRMDIS